MQVWQPLVAAHLLPARWSPPLAPLAVWQPTPQERQRRRRWHLAVPQAHVHCLEQPVQQATLPAPALLPAPLAAQQVLVQGQGQARVPVLRPLVAAHLQLLRLAQCCLAHRLSGCW